MRSRTIGFLLVLAAAAEPALAPAAARQGDDEVVGTDSDVILPVLVPSSRTTPGYPEESRLLGLEAHVTFRAVVRKDGNVDKVSVVSTMVRKPGSRSAAGVAVGPDDDYGFGAAATATVKTWKYQAGTRNGEPVDVLFTVMVDFALAAAAAEPFEAGIGGVTNPILHQDSEQAPRYSKAARRKHGGGRSILRAVILKDGTVDAIRVLSTTLKFEDGSERVVELPVEPEDDFGFGAASVAAVKTWRYEPGMFRGAPVDVYFTVLVDFVLESPRPPPAAPPTPA
jgi:outer membrane biosynthesis protein TonB